MLNAGSVRQEAVGNAVVLFLCIALASAVVFTSTRRASNLPICTDSVEYALGAKNIAGTGHFFICIRGEALPSRYPPWFSLFAITPAYLLFGKEVGNAILPITFFSLAGVVAAFLIGHRMAGNWGGFVSVAVLLLMPAYRAYSHHVMTEIPCAALALLLGLVYLEMRITESTNAGFFLIAGLLAGLSAAFRPACASFVLPFCLLVLSVRPFSALLWRALLILVPQVVIAVATLAYNHMTFGSISTNGYLYWCPQIFSDFRLVFSPSFTTTNLFELFVSGLPALAITSCCLWFGHTRTREGFLPDKRKMANALASFILVGTGPIVVLHLFYFWYDQRFFLPSLALLAALTGGMIGLFLRKTSFKLLIALQAAAVLVTAALRLAHPAPSTMRFDTAERVNTTTPTNSLIISCIDPLYVEHFVCRDSQRRVLPMTRNVDYTSTVVVWRASVAVREQEAMDTGPEKTRTGLYPYVAEERVDLIAKELSKGTPVFMDTSQVLESDVSAVNKLSACFNLTKKADYLYELTPKQTNTPSAQPARHP
jgi:4-amino-4-deoxy-L-arabinose transferase-like glycosyltransferase